MWTAVRAPEAIAPVAISSPPPASRRASRARALGAGPGALCPRAASSADSVSIPAAGRCVPGRAAGHGIARPAQDIPGAAEAGQPLTFGHARARVTGEGVERPVVVGDLEVAAGVFDRPHQRARHPVPALSVVAPLVTRVSGHAWVQPFAWVQVIFPPFSEVSMYKVWPCPLTRTAPTPGTLFALIVAKAADEAPAGALLPGEPAAVLEDD